MRHRSLLLQYVSCLSVLLSCSLTVNAQDRDAILKNLKETSLRWEGEFNEHDASALAALYAEECDVVHSGKAKSARQELEAEFRDVFRKNPAISCVLKNQTWKVLSPTLVIETGEDHELGVSNSPPKVFAYSTVFEKKSGHWKIIYERSWEAENPRAEEPLNIELVQQWNRFLDGEWNYVLKADSSEYRGLAKWTAREDGKSIRAEFSTDEESAWELGIWYPATKRWVARGSGTGDNHWTLDFTEVNPQAIKAIYYGRNMEGTLFKGTFVGQRIDADTYEWKAVAVDPDGKELKSTGLYKRKK